MTDFDRNDAGVAHARGLIDDGKVDAETEWSAAAPSTDQENELIDAEGYDGFGRWHLAIDVNATEETKGRFAFPYGDFTRVNRAALIHAKQRASQNDHEVIVEVADELLGNLDRRGG